MKYIGIEFVDAVPMTAEVAEEKGYRVSDNKGDGYEVTYEDGYQSWCPKDVFEKHNYFVKNEELAKTYEGMVSPDYRERFKAEYIQLKNRYGGLRRMLDEWEDGKLSFKPSCPRSLLEIQATHMANYLMALKKRAAIEEIELDD